ncbi:hypothetical protein L2E82_29484 [Cichorium intybus]|uniref:Uncharacterized protein n=1 Tax=Cichorium intybus TaxID=13427 RepID=A0ACB9CYD0_CICIN|nr:hypothetical protein L2E82_29484 [Cichorium intybus]
MQLSPTSHTEEARLENRECVSSLRLVKTFELLCNTCSNCPSVSNQWPTATVWLFLRFSRLKSHHSNRSYLPLIPAPDYLISVICYFLINCNQLREVGMEIKNYILQEFLKNAYILQEYSNFM